MIPSPPSCQFESFERRVLLAAAPAVPNPFLFMSGYSDPSKSAFQQILPYYTAIGGITTDAALVQDLRAKGKLFLHQTIATPTKTVAQLVADWSAPFNNTLGGALPGGFDAIQIDEFGAYPDGSAEATKYATALQQLRGLYPDKRIFVWSVWSVADGGPNTLYGNPAATYSTLLNAINSYADRYMLETYINEANPQLSLFNPFADNIESFAPGLRAKTVFGLYIAQNGFVADDSTNLGYWGYLDAQLHTIRNDPEMSTMPGAAFWIWYRAERMTGDYVGRLVNHYFTQKRTTYFGDGSTAQLIANPQFESNTTGWTLTPGAGGALTRFNYTTDGVPSYHDDFGYASHQSWGLKMLRGTTADSASYTAAVTPGTTYTVSAFVRAGGAGSANRAKVTVTTASGAVLGAKEVQDPPTSTFTGGWKRILFHCDVPAGETSVKVVLGDSAAAAGTTLYWDFIELESAFAADANAAPPAVVESWFEVSPLQAIGLRFNEDVAPTLIRDDVRVTNVQSGVVIPSASLAVSYAGGTAAAMITFPGIGNAALPDGHYRITVPAASVADRSGLVLQVDYTFEIFVGTGTSQPDAYTLRRSPGGGGGGDAVEITHNGGAPFIVPLQNLTLVAISTVGGNDTLDIDLANGLPWPSGGLVYHLGLHVLGDTLKITGSPGSDAVTVSAAQVSISSPAGAATLPLNGVETVRFDGTGGDDTMTVAAAGGPVPEFRGGSGNDSLDVNAGTYVFSEDPVVTTANLALNVAAGGAAIANAALHLRGLNMTGGSFAMAPNGSRVLSTRSLSIAAGTLDLADNDMIIDYGDDVASPVGDIRQWIGSGYNFGGWDGSGVITSRLDALSGVTALAIAEARDSQFLAPGETALFSGQTVDATCVLVKYTYAGDANLDGRIDGGDYGIIDNFAQVPGADGYANGDFNYDGVIDGGDYGIIDNNNQAQGAPL